MQENVGIDFHFHSEKKGFAQIWRLFTIESDDYASIWKFDWDFSPQPTFTNRNCKHFYFAIGNMMWFIINAVLFMVVEWSNSSVERL